VRFAPVHFVHTFRAIFNFGSESVYLISRAFQLLLTGKLPMVLQKRIGTVVPKREREIPIIPNYWKLVHVAFLGKEVTSTQFTTHFVKV
jgi:hypothetical protein